MSRRSTYIETAIALCKLAKQLMATHKVVPDHTGRPVTPAISSSAWADRRPLVCRTWGKLNAMPMPDLGAELEDAIESLLDAAQQYVATLDGHWLDAWIPDWESLPQQQFSDMLRARGHELANAGTSLRNRASLEAAVSKALSLLNRMVSSGETEDPDEKEIAALDEAAREYCGDIRQDGDVTYSCVLDPDHEGMHSAATGKRWRVAKAGEAPQEPAPSPPLSQEQRQAVAAAGGGKPPLPGA